ncbi:hypothetical protein HHX47_DHR1000819 [Lentinula edodes]|nr:hypothetical protein HHX47_DHR1000819 [Lentinula edodes]
MSPHFLRDRGHIPSSIDYNPPPVASFLNGGTHLPTNFFEHVSHSPLHVSLFITLLAITASGESNLRGNIEEHCQVWRGKSRVRSARPGQSYRRKLFE